MIRPKAAITKVARPDRIASPYSCLRHAGLALATLWPYFSRASAMRTFSTVLAAIALSVSGTAMADRGGWRDHHDRYHRHYNDFRTHHHHDHGRNYRGLGHRPYAPHISYHYYGAPTYPVAPPRHYGGYGHHGYRGGGVTIVLPPIRIGN